MTVPYRETVVPLTEHEEYLLQMGEWVKRKSRQVRAKPNEKSEHIPFLTRLDTNGNIEHLHVEPCGCRYTRSSDTTAKFTIQCGKGRECALFVK